MKMAGYGISINSLHFGDFRNLLLMNFASSAMDFNVVATLGEARDNTKNSFENITIRQLEAFNKSIGMRLDGDTGANTSNNDFRNISILHNNGVGIKF